MAFGVDDAIAAGLRIVDKIVPDPAAKAAAALEAVKLKQAGEFKAIEADLQTAQMQADINRAEAGHRSMFVSGWRPFIGWVCGAALCTNYFIVPALTWVSPKLGMPPPPMLDLSELWPLLLGLLGLGGLRTVEKVKGVAR